MTRHSVPWVRDVTADAIQHFAWGIGDNNPLWVDEDHGRRSGWGGTIAPPSFLYAVDETTVAPEHPELRRVYSAVQWVWYDVVRLGSTIDIATELMEENSAGPDDRPPLGQTGNVHFSVSGSPLADAVVTCTRPSREAIPDPAAPEIRYTPDELAHIESTVLGETRRGSNPRMWEEVEPGDSLGSLLKGPLSIMDIVAWCAGAQGAVTDEEFSEGGLQAQTATGPQQIAWMVQLVTDWMGDDGFLHRLDAAVASNPPLGSTTAITGEITGLTETPAPTFTANIEARDQRGNLTASATATGLLPSNSSGPVVLPVVP